MRLSRGRVALVAVAGLLLVAALALLSRGVRAPGSRGAGELSEGFRPGRWDAFFLVARGPAAVVIPEVASEVQLRLSGPARVVLRSDLGEERLHLGAATSEHKLLLPRGGRIALAADQTIRLHEVSVRRTSPGLVSLPMARLALRVLFQRLLPLAIVLLLALSFGLRHLLPRAARSSPSLSHWPTVFGVLAAALALVQVFVFDQPLLIGDPAAYYEIGGRFRDALSTVRTPDDLAAALQTLRPYGGLAFTGLVYGGLRRIHDSAQAIYAAQALAIGALLFFLTRAAQRIGGRSLSMLVGVLALLYPTFFVIPGLVQPEPFLLALWAFALDATLDAVARQDSRRIASAGLGFGLGLALHPQGMWFLLFALLLALGPFAGALSLRARRPLSIAFVLGLLPVALTTAAGEAWARPTSFVLDDRHGFWAYTAPMPLGFWLFLDTDGWQGPQRVDDTRYGRAFKDAEEKGEVAGAADRLVFTARFVALNFGASLRTVLRNLHRLFDVPDNPARQDYILPYPAQLAWHRVLLVLFLLALPLAYPGPSALLYLPFAMLAMTYPLYHVFNKYALPATPFLLLGAGLSLLRLAERKELRLAAGLMAATLGAVLPAHALVSLGAPPLAARGVLLGLHLGGLALAFHAAALAWGPSREARALTALAALTLIVPTVAAEWGDPGWRSYAVSLDRAPDHEIRLGPEGLAPIETARESFLAFDLQVPRGDTRGIELRFASGLVVAGEELQPTMPSFGLATTRFHRDPRTFRQWWRLPWRSEMVKDGRLRVTLHGAREALLFGALGAGAEAPELSLGEWPFLSVYRLMHDGEYRLARPWATAGSRVSRVGERELSGALGVRLVTLAPDRALARVETAPPPKTARGMVTAVWARGVPSGSVDLEIGDLRVPFRYEGRGTLARFASGELRYAATGDAEGWYLLRLAGKRDEPLTLTFRPRQEMASPYRVFVPLHRETPEAGPP